MQKKSAAVAAVLGGVALAGAMLVTGSPAQAATIAAPCGHSIEHTIGSGQRVVYRHCTGGGDSVKVKAIINRWPDSSCTTVGPNEEKELTRWIWPASFNRIVRC